MLSGQVDNLKQDNVKLYVKIRFLHAWWWIQKTGKHSGVCGDQVPRDYKQKLDHFQSFSQVGKKDTWLGQDWGQP